jgi:inositol phosphorylceramide mannosyltransferase catalytic subunit
MQYKIPRRIIQTGKTNGQPLRLRAMMSTMRLLNQDYEYLFFDDDAVESFVTERFPQYKPMLDSFPYRIQRYDFFRYLAVYHFGGFYFDLDVLLAKGLSDLLESGCVFPFEGLTYCEFLREHHKMDWQIGNYAFGAAQGHPFLEAVIRNCVRAFEDPAWVQPMMRGIPILSRTEFLVMNTTGPGLISRTLAEERAIAGAVHVLFPDDVCDGRNWNCFGDLGVHLTDGSWRPKSGFLRRRLALYCESLKMQRLIQESLRLGKVRHHVSVSPQ